MAARGAGRIPRCANFVALLPPAHYVGAPMKLLGLTGGIGMGKSTVAALLVQHGLPVVDTDVIARQVVEPGQPALDEIVAVFGREVLSADGSLRRDEVARQVFADKALRQQLEAITHPRIRAAWQAQVESWRFAGKDCAVVVIPLLFETAAEKEFEAIHCVACTAATQRQRLLARGWSDEQIQRRIASQWPIDKKMALANAVIWTEGAMESTEQQVKQLLARA